MFWGLSLKANKKYSQTVTKAFHVSQAALDISNSSDEPIQVVLTWDKNNYILCTLRKNKTEQVSLDLNFAEGDEISFTSQGSGNIHLAGYFMPDPEDMFGESQSESSSEEDVEDSPKKEKVLKFTERDNSVKQVGSIEEENDSEFDDSDENDSDSDELEEPHPKQAKLEKKHNGIDNGKIKKEEKIPQHKSSEKSLSGGVKVEDIRVGNGQEAKSGKKVQVYYEGRLKSNNKLFDSSKQGTGFKFVLGRGEVIRGWDIGVAGMKVGGKRRIICPPNMAYGAKGSPPVIPSNSTLVFEVELKGVH